MKLVLAGVGALAIALFLLAPLPTGLFDAPRTPNDKKTEPEATIIFGGDMIFDRYIRQIFETVGGDYIFSCVAPPLIDADAAVANLEGPITTNLSVAASGSGKNTAGFTFTFPPETAALLKRHNISIVSLDNNHTADFGREGVEQTKQFLKEAGVEFFGGPKTSKQEPVLRTDIKGVPLSFIGYNEFEVLSSHNSTIHETIVSEKENGRVVVVYAHWGEEYTAVVPRVRTLAHRFAEAGAALIIGSHPHIVQESEEYEGARIFYSLGNFVFDQYFSDAVREGLLLSVTFSPAGVSGINEIPIILNPDGRTCLREFN